LKTYYQYLIGSSDLRPLWRLRVIT